MTSKSEFFGDNVPVKKKKSKKKNKVKKNNNQMSLQEFVKRQEEKAELNKPKKWKSKRLSDKKDKLGIKKEPITRRRFNPRLPPPTYLTFKKKVVEEAVLSDEFFPNLSSVDTSKNLNVNV